MDAETEVAQLDATTFAVRDLIAASQDLVVRMAKVMRMNVSDMTAIQLLADGGPLGAADLAERLGIRSASATVLVDRLEAAGYVQRTRHADDRRRVTVAVTDRAREVSLAAWLPGIRALDEVSRSLSADEAALVRDVLARLAATMDRVGRDRS